MTNVFPRRNLPDAAEPWGRTVQTELAAVRRELVLQGQTANNANRANSSQLAVLGRQIDSLTSLLAQTQDIVNRISDTGNVYTDVNTGIHSGAGWSTSRPSVTASSVSGRFLVSVQGTCSGTTAFVTFSAPGYDRTRAIGGTAAAWAARAEGSGGVTATNTTFGQWVATATPNTPITFFGESYGVSEFSAITAVKITVQPVL